MRRTLSFGAVVLVVLFAAGAWALWPRSGTPTKKEDAVAEFRAKGDIEQTKKDDGTTETDGGKRLPASGVYTFLASGQESVKFGPLPAETRVHSAPVVATVASLTNDCVDLQVSLFAEHTESTTYCSSGDGLAITAHTMSMKVGAVPAAPSLNCDKPLEIQPGAGISDDHSCTLELKGGPATVSADVMGKTEVGEPMKMAAGGTEVEVVPVTVSYIASGRVTGTWIERMWMSTANWMPVKIERQIALVGPANIDDESTLELASLEPSI